MLVCRFLPVKGPDYLKAEAHQASNSNRTVQEFKESEEVWPLEISTGKGLFATPRPVESRRKAPWSKRMKHVAAGEMAPVLDWHCWFK
jgi:hypothetical protein